MTSISRAAIWSRSSARDARALQPEQDVLAHREPGKQRVFLEHDAAIDARAGDAAAVDQHLAFGGEKAADDIEQRALAAARRTDDRDELALADRQIDGASAGTWPSSVS